MCPITRFQQIIRLEQALMCPVRKSFKHAGSIKVPHGCAGHDIQSERPKDEKIHGRVDLFHESVLLDAGAHVAIDSERAYHALHEKFAGKGEDDSVEGNKGEVTRAFPVMGRGTGVEAGVSGNQRVVWG